jgi:dienelactone hydrolase
MGRTARQRLGLATLFCFFSSIAGAQIFEPVSIPLVYDGHQIQITGRFEKPPGAGPFPAVILLHGCEGYQPGLWHTTTMANVLHHDGYATLIIDSYTPRGYTTCDSVSAVERVLDVYAAAAMLAGRAEIQRDKIAVLGFAQGGGTAIITAAVSAPAGPGPVMLKDIEEEQGAAYLAKWQAQFKDAAANFAARGGKIVAYVALYPSYCHVAQHENFAAPLLILIGEWDNQLSGEACEQLAAVPRPGAPEVRFKLYPGASRGFDVTLGHRSSEYSRFSPADRDAANDAPLEIGNFLHQYLK